MDELSFGKQEKSLHRKRENMRSYPAETWNTACPSQESALATQGEDRQW